VLIEKKKNGRYCFTHGWLELNNVYQLKHGGSVTLVVVHPNRFVMKIKDRYNEEINYPKHSPPLFLRLKHEMFPEQMSSEFVIKKNTMFHMHMMLAISDTV
jgi:hypothetical protein